MTHVRVSTTCDFSPVAEAERVYEHRHERPLFLPPVRR
jgi:hypothetical protein